MKKDEQQAIYNKAAVNRVAGKLQISNGAVLKNFATTWETSEIKDRATVYLPKSLDRKMRFMSWKEERPVKVLYTEAIQYYVTEWEKIKGEIDL